MGENALVLSGNLKAFISMTTENFKFRSFSSLSEIDFSKNLSQIAKLPKIFLFCII